MKTIAIATLAFVATVAVGVGLAAVFLAAYLALAAIFIVPIAAGVAAGVGIARYLNSQ
ncbi:hypothetical protein [Leifsonia sp. fls2-241-R2A-40a]|uniref:hypothetical protein n=1 Tax=Leifsonia sp. fls2-241-R2A-40a TaxID=3040290 RepID=UPI00254CF9E0|nr:hypothetical protein [Leifsonia sp. fls2-241-R2A-40a]